MKNSLLVVILFCPVAILKPEQCKSYEINEGYLFHEERESLKKALKLQKILGEDPTTIHAKCFEAEQEESKTKL